MAINVGDVYFVGYFGNGTTNGTTNSEGFAIVVKNTIASGEVLNFTDNALQANQSFATNEQTITFTVPAGGIAAGTVLEFPLNGTMQTTVYANDGMGGRTPFGTMSISGNTGLSNSGDQLFAYQGALATPNVLAGIDVANNSPVAAGSGTATSTNTTYAPTNGAPFLDFPQGTNNVQLNNNINPGTATPAQLTDTANYSSPSTATDPNASFEMIACFATGTRIQTARGEVPVEQLLVGDIAVTPDGRGEPIRWIGHRKLDCRRHPEPRNAMPVRISAHAFGPDMPVRDLLVSPGHGIFVDHAGGVLIPAVALVNGATIVQVDVSSVTYWHVELATHDIVFAENLASESYIDTGNRCFFMESGIVDLKALPDSDPKTHADFCRPFHGEGPVVTSVLAELRARAEESGWTLEPRDLDEVRLEVDGVLLAPKVRGLAICFSVPASARDVWLVSSASVPAEIAALPDRRALGMRFLSVAIEDGFGSARHIAADDERFCIGFHGVEQDGDVVWRWTAGRSRLPTSLWDGAEGDFFLRMELAEPPLPVWKAPAQAIVRQGFVA